MPEFTLNDNFPFEDIINLLTSNQNIPQKLLSRFSDLSKENLEILRIAWGNISKESKNSLFSSLIDINNSETIYCFDDIANLGLQDTDSEIIIKSINLCEECQNKNIARSLLDLLKNNSDAGVKEAAIDLLGSFVFLGELDKIPEVLYKDIQSTLINIFKNEDYHLLKQKSLEALGYSSHHDVKKMIFDAYHTGDNAWIKSAIIAMGKSADSIWEDILVNHLSDPDYDVQIEAIKAVGEIGIQTASEELIELLEASEEIDLEFFSAILWSLSQIGGKNVHEIFQYLIENAETDEERIIVEDALENLEFIDGLPDLSMFDFTDLENDIYNN